MGSDSVTRQEVYQQLINAKNRPASSLEEYFEKDLKVATASISPPSLPSITVTIAVPSISGQLVRDLFTSTSGAHKSNSSQAVIFPQESVYVTSSLLNQLEEYRRSVHINCLAVVVLAIRNDDPNNIERDLALYSPHDDILEMVRIFTLYYIYFYYLFIFF